MRLLLALTFMLGSRVRKALDDALDRIAGWLIQDFVGKWVDEGAGTRTDTDSGAE
jgi:hypothetical protein